MSPLYASETTCGLAKIKVHSSDRTGHGIICAGAHDAIRFLKSQGLVVENGISIEVVSKMPHNVSNSAIGIRLASERRTLILRFSEFKKQRKWFGIAIDKSLYRSVVAHEVAHAIAADNFKISSPSIQAQEYIAYVTQFSTMQGVQRKKIMALNQDQAFDHESQMNTTIYLFDPKRFGIGAYRHFMDLPDGKYFLNSVLKGKALAE
jgi:hypothetical protein